MLINAIAAYLRFGRTIIYSYRESRYTSQFYRDAATCYGNRQNMNGTESYCYDNALYENIWARPL